MNLKKKYDFDEPPSGSDETPFSDDEQKIHFYAHTEKGRQNADLFFRAAYFSYCANHPASDFFRYG